MLTQVNPAVSSQCRQEKQPNLHETTKRLIRFRTPKASRVPRASRAPGKNHTQHKSQGKETGRMSRREREPAMNLYSRSKRQLYIRHVQFKPLDRAGCIDNILEELGRQR